MHKNVFYALGVLLLTAGLLLCHPAAVAAKGGSFTVGDKTFLLNGKPFVVKAAEIHYPRIPRPYWDQRIKMCKSLGMNTLCVYVFWNIHEQQEGRFDFTGNNDLAAFIRLAQKNGMYVIVRPGPYVCAEWEMGGLPWWLLKKKDIHLRERDPYFMERLRLFEQKVGEQIGGLTIDKGGPIIMVQVENEYGSYGEDKPYIAAVRDIIRQSGFDKVTLFQCDWSSNFTRNGLDDLVWTMNFGTGANVDNEFRHLKELRPNAPLMCSEFWSGWFDKWGGRHETRGSREMVSGLKEMLDKNISFSLYMTHGGTNWGHWAGANSPGFAPDVTSYDYDAPINEAGQPTPKFWELRQMMAGYMGGQKQAPVPPSFPVITIPAITFGEMAPLFSNLPQAKPTADIKTMEDFDQGWGSIVYSTQLPDVPQQSVLTLTDAHDFAQVFLGGQLIGSVDRRNNEHTVVLPPIHKGDRLDIVVEAMGRINFGRAIKDYKGITQSVTLSYELENQSQVSINLRQWQVYNLPDGYADVAAWHYVKFVPMMSIGHVTSRYGIRNNAFGHGPAVAHRVPGCYRASFSLTRTGDTFLNMESWGKGQVYVNGHALGRFWNIGPQQTLYLPGCWLRKGQNEIIVLDLVGPAAPRVEGLAAPVLDKLNLPTATHRRAGETLRLAGLQPAMAGTFAPGGGWQEVKLAAPATGRYVCLQCDDAHDGGSAAAIAELYLLGARGERLSREAWTVRYASSEDADHNRTADKVFDLQESTYWTSAAADPYPHYLVIDLGAQQTLTGLQYLPRMEQGAPGSVKGYKLFVSPTDFAY
jgi:beta-galactosidase